MWHTFYLPASLEQTLELLDRYGDTCRIIAGGTDLILELERGQRTQEVLIDISRISGLDSLALTQGQLILGALVSHNQVVASPLAVQHAFPLAQACWLVGAPQIRNRGTVAGNLVTASPANDTITPLWAMDATLTLTSRRRGERVLACDQFFLGVRRTALAPDEMVTAINVPVLGPHERGIFLKLGLRQAQAISLVNVAVILDFAASSAAVRRARIALGSVAPTILRAVEAENYLAGQELDTQVIERAGELAAAAARPISDVRASADYRRDMVRVMVSRALRALRDGTERTGWPARPVLLATPGVDGRRPLGPAAEAMPDRVSFTLNGRQVMLHGVRGKTLLRALREDAGLTGTKEGCAEGECGACTVWLDGKAVMSCLVPVERAEGCEILTVEGLATSAGLHPLQQAFIDAGAVQCGYCTPGLLMSASKLLQELPHPTHGQVQEALTGNLCRCTGYYKIIQAVEMAAQRGDKI